MLALFHRVQVLTQSRSARLQVLACVQDLGLCVRMPTADCPIATMPRLPGLLSGLRPIVAYFNG